MSFLYFWLTSVVVFLLVGWAAFKSVHPNGTLKAYLRLWWIFLVWIARS